MSLLRSQHADQGQLLSSVQGRQQDFMRKYCEELDWVGGYIRRPIRHCTVRVCTVGLCRYSSVQSVPNFKCIGSQTIQRHFMNERASSLG